MTQTLLILKRVGLLRDTVGRDDADPHCGSKTSPRWQAGTSRVKRYQ